MICTIYKNIISKEPHYITVEDALSRISNGRTKDLVEAIRRTIDKNSIQELKKNLPSVCFSGKFKGGREDKNLIVHSGFIVLDFDNVENIRERQTEIISNTFIYACWLSPSGKGLKALVKIKSGESHREHFLALLKIFPDADRSGINVGRVCYESYDPEIYNYPDSLVFEETIKEYSKTEKTYQPTEDEKTFGLLVSWLSHKKEAFVTGERNNFIFKLAAACCRFGIAEQITEQLIENEFLINSDFTQSESRRTIKSAYKANNDRFATCKFEKQLLVDKDTGKETSIDETIFDPSIKPKDVIYGSDVRPQAINIYKSGYQKLFGINVPKFDEGYKPKRGEVTLLTGIGNYGKSHMKKWYQVFRAVLYGEKCATFGPEDSPAEEYYHDLTEILLGCDCTPYNHFKPSQKEYEAAYDFITKHFFYIYPESSTPTPEYIQERFLELIIKEKIDWCDVDPFNQLSNQYHKYQGRDKYLEFILGMFGRFAQINQVYFLIIAHPKQLVKQSDGNYPCPDVFDVADGAMWNNKMDNILVYHRPFAQSQPHLPVCEFHSKKIRRQKSVGKRGNVLVFELNFERRRFYIDGEDVLKIAIENKKLNFTTTQQEIGFKRAVNQDWLPYKDNDGNTIDF